MDCHEHPLQPARGRATQVLYDVLIEGNKLERVYDKLTEGKRVSVKVTGDTVVRISVTKVETVE